MKPEHEEKLKKLNKARITLKNKFFGIDDVIDKICDQITPWFVFDIKREVPLVINIWGITGTGKTELVKDICNLLELKTNFYDSQTFVGQGLNPSSFMNSAEELLEPYTFRQAIIIDEIHRIKTKRQSDALTHNDERFRLWELLSGTLRYPNRVNDRVLMFDCYIESLTIDASIEIRNNVKKRFFQDLGYATPKLYRKGCLYIAEMDRKFSLDENGNFISSIKEFFAECSTTDEVDVKQHLVFILGNLDAAYRRVVNDLETLDADDLSIKMRTITVQECKEALLTLFQPEQVSRLGSNHIIMPTLMKKSYENIIRQKLEQIATQYLESYAIGLVFDQTVKEMLYDQIVIPSQGLRNVLSGFNCLLDTPLASMIEQLINGKGKEGFVLVSFKANNYIFEMDDLKVIKEVDLLKRKDLDSPEFTHRIAIHEGGHALVHYLVTKKSPKKIVVATNSSRMGGYIIKDEIEIRTKKDLINDVMISFGGYFAEKLTFGVENISIGSFSDLRKAGSTISTLINDCGLGDKITPMVRGNPMESPLLRTTEKEKDKEISKLYEKMAKETEKLLSDNEDKLVALADFLKQKISVTQEEMDEFMKTLETKSNVVEIPLLTPTEELVFEEEILSSIN